MVRPARLEVRDLSISFDPADPAAEVVSGIDLDVGDGEVVALVGESGSGKSVTAAAILGLLPRPGRVTSGSVRLNGEELLGLSQRQLAVHRGSGLGVIFQNSLTSLDPSFTVGNQLAEIIGHHSRSLSRVERRELAAGWLERVGIVDAERVLRAYPHELSGGMRQRVMIALASLSEPALLIADEPTTALDTVVQRQVLDVLLSVVREQGSSLLIITHDFEVVEHVADRVVVLREGAIVESGDRNAVLSQPQDPYTELLLEAVPRLGARARLADFDGPRSLASGGIGLSVDDEAEPGHRSETRQELLRVDAVTRIFTASGIGAEARRRDLTAIDEVSFTVGRGEAYGLIGPSGSGKTTLARMIGGLLPVSSGEITFDATAVTGARPAQLRPLRRRFQYVFQDPSSSLNPRLTVGEQILRPMRRFGLLPADRAGRREALAEALERVDLSPDLARRHPHALSGGQRQRIGLARALALGPEMLVLDEPTSALDVSTQARLVDLLVRLRSELGLTYVLIAHDLALVEWICDRIGVLDHGVLADEFAAQDLHATARAPITRALLDARLSRPQEVTP